MFTELIHRTGANITALLVAGIAAFWMLVETGTKNLTVVEAVICSVAFVGGLFVNETASRTEPTEPVLNHSS